jgi:hypothetical protein
MDSMINATRAAPVPGSATRDGRLVDLEDRAQRFERAGSP